MDDVPGGQGDHVESSDAGPHVASAVARAADMDVAWRGATGRAAGRNPCLPRVSPVVDGAAGSSAETSAVPYMPTSLLPKEPPI